MRKLASLLIVLPLLTGCATMERLESVRSVGEKLMDSTVMATTLPEGSLLTKKEAEDIALERAGLTRQQVSLLQSEYDFEEGRHTWEVEFRQGFREYSARIDAETGEILEWERE
jgi:uncharacterized membrane protein YkoI